MHIGTKATKKVGHFLQDSLYDGEYVALICCYMIKSELLHLDKKTDEELLKCYKAGQQLNSTTRKKKCKGWLIEYITYGYSKIYMKGFVQKNIFRHDFTKNQNLTPQHRTIRNKHHLP